MEGDRVMAGEDRVKELVRHYTKRVQELRRQIHANPELSYEEVETAALVAGEIRALGAEVEENVAGGHGVIATIQGRKPGRTIGLRADMDALSIQEETGLPFTSKHSGKMHACGHDAHTAMLLGAAHVLWDMRDSFDGTVKLIFQPAEEKTPEGGAKAIVASGVLGAVDAVYGLHVWPQLPTGTIGVKAGPVMAASDHVTVTIHGQSSHAAMPHKGVDAIAAAAQFITAAQDIISRQTNPLHPSVLTFGLIQGGTRYNIIPDEVVVEGTCRTYNPDTQDYIEGQLGRLLGGLDMMFGTNSTLLYERGHGAVINSVEQAALAAQVVRERFGESALAAIQEPAMTAEDFSAYLNAYGGAFLWLGTAEEGKPAWPLHHPQFSIDEKMLPQGVELLSSLALKALQ